MWSRLLGLITISTLASCTPDSSPYLHGPIGEGIMGRLGEVLPAATDEQKATFLRGQEVARRRFDLEHGLGPAFNVTFCGACHERPTLGGSAALYRNFFLTGHFGPDGAFFIGNSAGRSGGVLRMYYYGEAESSRPAVPEVTTVFAQRNPIPAFGIGLIAELSEDEILSRADPDDVDGDGISGRPNYESGFVGRFGRKAQTASVEGFIRGPLFNHAGVTTDALTDEQRARLPVDSTARRDSNGLLGTHGGALRPDQAAVTDEKLTDADVAADPEMSRDDLFDLISFSMLLGVGQVDEKTDHLETGRAIFDEVGCGACHVPRLVGPHGPIPIYSDLLLHDMGPALADRIHQGLASGAEFRTQPLWNVAATPPYLHDGRAGTLDAAIRMHGGEAEGSRDRLLARGDGAMADLVDFLRALGGRDQASAGLTTPDDVFPEAGTYGGPVASIDASARARFEAGRRLFDRDFSFADGLGGPRFNGDSCRACHFDPVLGGSGPRDVNVMRHGIVRATGEFVVPAPGTVLHKDTRLRDHTNLPQADVNVFEHRQTPHLFGAGLIDAVPEATILAHADPDDADGDGISGRPSWTPDGRLGRFGWKAQVPSLAEFVRDAMATELGMTVEAQDGLVFGRLEDDDDVPDPELSAADAETLSAFIGDLAPPPRTLEGADRGAIARGATVFADAGCVKCHLPSLASARGQAPLYSDLLLHEILPVGATGIEEGSASMRELRTAPLWGLAKTAPYWHTGEADTIEAAIELHAAEGAKSRDLYRALDDARRAELREFLRSL